MKETNENWKKRIEEQWGETDHWIIWGNWIFDAIEKILLEAKQQWQSGTAEKVRKVKGVDIYSLKEILDILEQDEK